MAYFISERAAEDIYRIFEQGKLQFGERSAAAYQVLIGEAIRFAAADPLAGPVRETAMGPARVRYFGSHLVVYDVYADDIIVQRIFTSIRIGMLDARPFAAASKAPIYRALPGA